MGGSRRWGGGRSIAQCSRMEQDGDGDDDLPCTFSTAARGAGRWRCAIKVPHTQPSRGTERRRRVDGGTEGRRAFWFTTSPANRAVKVVGASLNRHLARRYFPQRRWLPLPSAGADACLTPSPFRHGGSLGETERAHGGRVATTQCCANHVVVPHLDSLTIPGRRSRCPRVDHTDLCSGHTGNLIPFPARGARLLALACQESPGPG